MGRIVIELTNRCNLSCTHCFEGRHSADGDLSIDVIETIIKNAKQYGFNHLALTGGDATIHPEFIEIIRIISEADYEYSFVTNGQNFVKFYKKILPFSNKLNIITFSIEGAEEKTNDKIRGEGSYRRLMKAVSVCIFKDIPFTFNFVITSHNYNEIEEAINLSRSLGARGIRFGHLMPTKLTVINDLVLSTYERKRAEKKVWKLQQEYSIPIAFAIGHYTKDLFPCTPLNMQEINIDWQGNVTKCCNLSSRGGDVGDDDIVGNLSEISFEEAYAKLVDLNNKFHSFKLEHHKLKSFKDSDYFPCWYCENYHDKVGWLKRYPKNKWSDKLWTKE